MHESYQFRLSPEFEVNTKSSLSRRGNRNSEKTPLDIAKNHNTRLLKRLEKRAFTGEDARFGPCLSNYIATYENTSYQPIDLLKNLTKPLIDALPDTSALIRQVMTAKWKGKPDAANQTERSIANSLRRTAGTNYQGLVSYALARFLLEAGSTWYISHPVPKEFEKALVITFTDGIPINKQEEQEEQEIDATESSLLGETLDEQEDDGRQEDDETSAATVQPDVDILLRNSAWRIGNRTPEPVVMLSLKTSLVDRAGMAARWKLYFDLATQPCCHQEEADCAYRRLGIQMENAEQYAIKHGIVTANIYKLNFSDPRYQVGELTSGQTRSNTYMFERGLKLTTRDDGIAITPPDWSQFQTIAQLLEKLSTEYGLPK